MRLFGKKLTENQEVQLASAVRGAKSLCEFVELCFDSLRNRLQPLYAAASASLAGRAPIAPTEEELNNAREAIAEHLREIENSRALATTYGDTFESEWCPKRPAQGFDSLMKSLEAINRCVRMVSESLQPPAFDRKPGKDKLNMFVSGLNLLAVLQKGLKAPVR